MPDPNPPQRLQGLISECQDVIWRPAETRRELEANGVHVIPANFYSTVPLLADLDSTFEGEGAVRKPFYNRIFNRDVISSFLDRILEFAPEFDPPLEGDEETCHEFFWNNSQFSGSDAVSYYATIRDRKPKRIVEIGSGFSTLVANTAIQANGFGEIVAIEPFPRPFLHNIAAAHVIQEPIQTLSPERFHSIIESADILFIDSTHTVKIGSDCIYIYLVLLPSIQKNILVHSHDIFLPFGMPVEWARDFHIYWTEQYLLYAYLLHNPAARVLLGTTYVAEFVKDKAEALSRGRPIGGGSLWYELNPPN